MAGLAEVKALAIPQEQAARRIHNTERAGVRRWRRAWTRSALCSTFRGRQEWQRRRWGKKKVCMCVCVSACDIIQRGGGGWWWWGGRGEEKKNQVSQPSHFCEWKVTARSSLFTFHIPVLINHSLHATTTATTTTTHTNPHQPAGQAPSVTSLGCQSIYRLAGCQ